MRFLQANIMLIDGIGALMSALFLGLVLPVLQPHIGMPLPALYFLSGLAVLFAIYSLSCHVLNLKSQNWLAGIIGANSLYCLVTIAIVVNQYSRLTVWGLGYFIFELLVILVLLLVERKVLRSLRSVRH